MTAEVPGSERPRRDVRIVLSQKNLPLAILLFLVPILGFVGCFVSSLAVGLPWSIPLSLAEAWFIGMAFIIGHDACHQSFTASPLLNGVIGRISFLPSLHSFSLWDLGHNRIHHRHNNVRGFDYVWEPLSPEDWQSAPRHRRAVYRFARSAVGLPFYYVAAIWLPKMFLVRRKVFNKFCQAYLWDAILVWSFSALELAVAIVVGAGFGRSAIEALLTAVLLPFAVWNALMSFVIYLHHTHPDVPWYRSVDEWRRQNGKLSGTVCVVFPWIVRKLMLNIMDHNAHHYAPGVPLYNLPRMQQVVEEERNVTWTFSLADFVAITRTCRLYDYTSGRWVDYPA